VVAHGLMAARRQVENGQATTAKHHAICGRTPEASVIGATMEQAVTHAQRGCLVQRAAFSDATNNATHVSELLLHSGADK
jgi:hypothetical protein